MLLIGDRLAIKGDWDTTPVEEGRKAVLLRPLGTVFGNGYHWSTLRFLQELESLIKPGDTVVDIGTGSGILAIAAAHLGASVVYATDLSPPAREMAQANAALNRVSGTIVVSRELPPLSPFVDVILANLGGDDLLPEVFQTAGTILRGVQSHIMVVTSNNAGPWVEAEALLHGLTKIKAMPTDEALYLIFQKATNGS